MLLVQIKEVGDRNRHFIWSIHQVHLLKKLFILDAFCFLVITYQVLSWVVDRVESLLSWLVDKFLLLYLQLEGFADFVFNCHLLHYQRRNKVLNCCLFQVAHSNAHVRTLLDLAAW